MLYRDAKFSSGKRYRYALMRAWDESADKASTCIFIGVNPSTADAFKDDATTRRCIDFGKRWGYKALLILNLFALVSKTTDPLRSHDKTPGGIVGRHNNELLLEYCRGAPLVVAAWGTAGGIIDRDKRVIKMLTRQANATLHCLAINKDGTPKHPLYARKDAALKVFAEGLPDNRVKKLSC